MPEFIKTPEKGSLADRGVSALEASKMWREKVGGGTAESAAAGGGAGFLNFWRSANQQMPEPVTGEVVNRPVITPQSTFDSQLQQLQQSQKTEEQIRQEQLQRAQAMIDATDEVFRAEMARLGQQGQERLQETRSQAVGAGLAGSPFQTAQTERTKEFTNQIIGARQKERAAEIQSILAQAQGKADTQIQQQLENFRKEREFLTSERDLALERDRLEQELQRDRALGVLGTIGSRGISAAEIPQEEYRQLLEQSGLSDFAAKAYIDSNKPQPERTYQVAGGKLIGYSVDPITGKVEVTSETIPGIEAAEEANIQQFGGVPYVITRDAQGNVKGSVLPGFERKTEDEPIEAPKVQKFGEGDFRQWNSSTGEWEKIDTATSEQQTQAERYQQERYTRAISNVEDLRSRIEQGDVLVGRAYDVQSALPNIAQSNKFRNSITAFDPLKSSIAFNELTAMREASKTGGALGQVAVAELQLLENSLASLDPRQTKGQIKKNLDTIKESLDRWYQASGTQATQGSTQAGIPQADIKDYMSEWGVDEQTARATLEAAMRNGQYTPSGDQAFKNEEQTSLKGGNVLSLGRITGYGSPYWKHGLDIDLKIGDPVPTPVSGKVIYAGKNGGFGNQVQIETPNGNKVWLSHLDAINVKVGDTISKGTVVGKGGNTGKVIPVGGGDGSHLDLTVQRPDGTYFTPKEIEQRLKQFA